MIAEPTAGFVRQDLIVYALQYTLATEPPSWLIVWLDRAGHSLHPCTRPAETEKRMVTVKPGDAIIHKGNELRVAQVAIYRALGEKPGREIVR